MKHLKLCLDIKQIIEKNMFEKSSNRGVQMDEILPALRERGEKMPHKEKL